ncbi:MAG TPA: acyclic terpene utilization AtuA family protein [Polyangiaceae bacterium]|nr:acyclic terpene utilization AtuA family protein [Polyangiaceae bacterium]
MPAGAPLRVANASAFYGDRFSAPLEMVEGGPIDVLTGDYLAELTMAILFRQKTKSPSGGYAATFLRQMEGALGRCLERGVRVVTNAGGLNPRGLAEGLERLASSLGLRPRVAYLEGDDVTARLGELGAAGERFCHLDRGTPLAAAGVRPFLANAYLGGFGIKRALELGADVVVCPRVADAALVVGPAAWRFGWGPEAYDELAGAVAAGHVLECGPQATGGNYAFFEEVPSFERVGYPIAEVREDGSAVITKHPGTGGLVSVGTVTAQLLYEIEGHRYVTPDVVARFDALSVTQAGPDRVLVSGARGEPAPATAKVALLGQGGFRNSVTFLLAGLDLEAKARLLEAELLRALGGRQRFASYRAELVRTDRPDPGSNDEAVARLRVTVTSPDPERVGRAFSGEAVALALASVPGLTLSAPPADASPHVVYWPTTLPARLVEQRVVFEGTSYPVAPPPAAGPEATLTPSSHDAPTLRRLPEGETVRAPFGRAFGTRSGDKGGNATLGVWARSPEAFDVLRRFLTTDRLRNLLPDLAAYPIERSEFANLWALLFVVRGLLGDGALANDRTDPQAKTLGEYLRAKIVELPASLVP